jgi:hypothetical protein
MKRAASTVLLVGLLIAGAVAIAGCAQSTAAEQKAACFANESLIQGEMKLFKEDSGIDAPLSDVIDKLHVKCPAGGTYSYDATTGVVTCSIHGHQ